MTDTVTDVKVDQGYATGKWCDVATPRSAGIGEDHAANRYRQVRLDRVTDLADLLGLVGQSVR